MSLSTVCLFLELTKQDLLKCWQYSAILQTWYHQRTPNPILIRSSFALYQRIFHIRRIYRLLHSIVYLPQILKVAREMRSYATFKGVFRLLGNIFFSLFFLFDNAAILLMMTGNEYYRAVRRLSYSTLLIGIVWQMFSIGIRLRENFTIESELKSRLEEMSPSEFIVLLKKIDTSRFRIFLEFIQTIGDLLPTFARTNLPETLLRTKINKGTVGVFGIVASLTNILLKYLQENKSKYSQG